MIAKDVLWRILLNNLESSVLKNVETPGRKRGKQTLFVFERRGKNLLIIINKNNSIFIITKILNKLCINWFQEIKDIQFNKLVIKKVWPLYFSSEWSEAEWMSFAFIFETPSVGAIAQSVQERKNQWIIFTKFNFLVITHNRVYSSDKHCPFLVCNW